MIKPCKQCSTEIEVPNNKWKLCQSCKKINSNDRCKQYKANNRKKVAAYNKLYKNENKKDISAYNKTYFQENKTQINNRRIGYHKKYYAKYPTAKIIASHRNRMNKMIKRKSGSSLDTLGCSKQFFKSWIEYQFHEWQTFENHGDIWQLDHCIPCTRFDLTNNNEVLRCFHWSNIQPLDKIDNLSKGDNTNKLEQFLQQLKIDVFIKIYGHRFKDIDYSTIKFNRYHYINRT